MVSGYESLLQLCQALSRHPDQDDPVTIGLLNDALQRVLQAISEIEN